MKRFLLCCSCLAFIAPFFFLNGCFLFHDSSPKETLPPATQTGANTFGCYVNGKLWLPKGYNGTSNLRLSYDPSFHAGALSLGAYRIENNMTQYIIIGSDSLSKIGIYYLDPKGRVIGYFNEFNNSNNTIGCFYNDYKMVQRKGYLTVTKLDLTKAIVSGTFELILYKSSNCDTIKITQGRFDLKM